MFPDFAIAGALLIMATSCHRDSRIQEACIALVLVIYSITSVPFIIWTTGFLGHTLDNYLFNVDRLIGLSTVPLARTLAETPWLWIIVVYVYSSLPLVIALGWLIDREIMLIEACLIGATVAPVLYVLFPAVGPIAAFPGWPFATIHAHFRMMAVTNPKLPRNAFPSMHFAWALLAWLNAQNVYWKAFTLLYLIAMAVATMGSGEHYAIDLIASAPLVWAIQKWAPMLREVLTSSLSGINPID